MKKLILILLFVFSSLLANDETNSDIQKIVDEFKKTNYFKAIDISSNKEEIIKKFKTTEAYKSIVGNSTIMEIENVINSALLAIDNEVIKKEAKAILEKEKHKRANFESEENLTIFYFVSKSISLDAIERFLYEYNKLKTINSGFTARIMFRGYPEYFDNKQSGALNYQNWYKADEYKTKFGSFKVEQNGKWKYTLNETKNLHLFSSNEIKSEKVQVFYGKEDKKKIELSFRIKRIGKKLALIVNNQPRGLVEFVKDVDRKTDIKPKDLKIQAHSFAFDEFNLKKVPAYALSYCNNEKNSFRFKQCKHKYLVRGEMGLDGFFQTISEEDKSFKKYYFDLIEAN